MYATPAQVREFKVRTRSIGNPRMHCQCTGCGFETGCRVSRKGTGQNVMNNMDGDCPSCKKTSTLRATVDQSASGFSWEWHPRDMG